MSNDLDQHFVGRDLGPNSLQTLSADDASRQRVKSQVIKVTLYLCCLLITFANNLDPDQARQNFSPDLDPICLTL